MNKPRRLFMKLLLLVGALVALFPLLRKAKTTGSSAPVTTGLAPSAVQQIPFSGVDSDGYSSVYMSSDGSPAANVNKVIDLMGGIHKIIGPTDIVVIKPNAQWWNQGMTNTDAIRAFIDMVLSIPGFSGEVIIAENHQYAGENTRGWSTEQRNGEFNYNELIEYYQRAGYANVTKYHWRVAGTTSLVLEGDAQGNSRVTGPWDGDGYVWLENEYYLSPTGRKCVMTYPVFTSSYSGISIDLKKGAWKDGQWLDDRNVRFINFSALNHHGLYCGVTASVKNLMGVVDMSCGFPGDAPANTYNTHHIGVSKLIALTRKRVIWRLANSDAFYRYCYSNFHHTAGALGHFMKTVRLPDLNIITAEWVGWGSRINTEQAFYPRTILASRDPVALDYVAARHVLLPGTPLEEHHQMGYSFHQLNDPDRQDGPYYRFLAEANRQGIGNLRPEKINLISYQYS